MIKIRMCICCRNRMKQDELLRLQLGERLSLFGGFGRSFYVCEICVKNKDCAKIINKIYKIKNENKTSNFKEIGNKWLVTK